VFDKIVSTPDLHCIVEKGFCGWVTKVVVVIFVKKFFFLVLLRDFLQLDHPFLFSKVNECLEVFIVVIFLTNRMTFPVVCNVFCQIKLRLYRIELLGA
jgi:hypothetical protein